MFDWRTGKGTDAGQTDSTSAKFRKQSFFALLSIHPNFVLPKRGRKGRGGKEPFCFFNISSFYGHRRLGGRKRQKIALNIPPPPPLNRKRNILRTYFLCLPHAERRQCLRVWEWPVFKKVFFKKNLVIFAALYWENVYFMRNKNWRNLFLAEISCVRNSHANFLLLSLLFPASFLRCLLRRHRQFRGKEERNDEIRTTSTRKYGRGIWCV